MLKLERTPEKLKNPKSAKKIKVEEKVRDEPRDQGQADGSSTRRGGNLENMIIVLHRQLHSMKI